MTRRRVVQAILASSAAAGLFGAHLIAYLIALPDAGVRTAFLQTTGHGYFSVAIVIAAVAGIFGVFAAAALGFRAGDGGERLAVKWRPAAPRIAVVQTIGFLVLEVAERAAANVSPFSMNPRLVATAVAVQVTLAVLAALVVSLITRLASTVADLWSVSVPPRRAIRSSVRLPTEPEPRPIFAGAAHARAPPLAAR